MNDGVALESGIDLGVGGSFDCGLLHHRAPVVFLLHDLCDWIIGCPAAAAQVELQSSVEVLLTNDQIVLSGLMRLEA